MKIGFGWDLHRLVADRKLMLGGVQIPAPFGEDGHSDGDVLLHAVIDAMLGAACLGDIGSHFPSGDPAWKNISSRVLLEKTRDEIRNAGYRIVNLDTTVVLQQPKILPFVPAIRTAIAADLGIPAEAVSVKGKTKEQVDATGEGRAIEAFAAVLLENDG